MTFDLIVRFGGFCSLSWLLSCSINFWSKFCKVRERERERYVECVDLLSRLVEGLSEIEIAAWILGHGVPPVPLPICFDESTHWYQWEDHTSFSQASGTLCAPQLVHSKSITARRSSDKIGIYHSCQTICVFAPFEERGMWYNHTRLWLWVSVMW